MRFKATVSEDVCGILTALDAKTKTRIKTALAELETAPFTSRPRADIKKLHGPENPALYRLRIGDYRAIYFVVGDTVKVVELMLRNK